jgi:integrase
MAAKKPRGRQSTYGEGSTFQNKKGEWFAVFPLGQNKRATRRVASKQAGDAWRQEMKRQRDEQHVDIATAQTTFNEYAEAWIAKQRKPKASTLKSYEDLLEYYILDFVDGVRLADLRKSHFDTMLRELLDDDYAISQIRNAINLAARILDDALGEDLIPKNYAALVRKDVPAYAGGSGTVLSVEQARQLIAAAPWRYHDNGQPIVERGQQIRNRFAPIYLIALLLGPRKGEVLGLRWAAVDFDRLTIRIDQQV